jgi:hypothetical protein
MSSETGKLTYLYLQVSSWVARYRGRQVILFLSALLSLPGIFCPKLSLGLDAAWRHSLQVAVAEGRVFGRDVFFFYGPLGYLLTRSPVSKLNLLLYDFFILGSLLSIYRKLLPAPMQFARAILVLALAVITKYGLAVGPAGILFIIAGYWLWRLYASDSFVIPLAGSLAAAVLLFFSKVNFGLLMMGLIPCYSLGLLICRRDGRRAAWLAAGFALLILIGSACWRVEVSGYLRASLEIIGGYNEAMFIPYSAHALAFITAVLLTLAVIVAALASLRTTAWRDWMMACPFVMLTVWLLFKNGFVRVDLVHIPMFLSSLPLLLAVWSVALPGSRTVKVLLVLSVLYGAGQPEFLGYYYSQEWFSWTPLRYARGVWVTPWRQNGQQLGDALRADWPKLVLPENMRSTIGRSSVDVMPWDSSLAILNGLNLKERPVLQSCSGFTSWLDEQNAQFLSSSNASDFILYVAMSKNDIDGRPAAWDESITKRTLIQNYTPCFEWSVGNQPKSAFVVVLRRSPGAWEYEPISTNSVTLALDQPLEIPASTNYEFLWLEAERTPRGKLAAFASQPAELTVAFAYSDGTFKDYHAVLPILKTGVLINYRVESAQEIRRWLSSEMTGNVTARSIRFKSASPWAFRSPFHGQVVTCRLVNRRFGGPTGSPGQ